MSETCRITGDVAGDSENHGQFLHFKYNFLMLSRMGIRPAECVCLGPACCVWVLAFVQERFHHMRPGDFESQLIKAGEGPRVEAAPGESLGPRWSSALFPRNTAGKK